MVVSASGTWADPREQQRRERQRGGIFNGRGSQRHHALPPNSAHRTRAMLWGSWPAQ
jgi:hypothetical protein